MPVHLQSIAEPRWCVFIDSLGMCQNPVDAGTAAAILEGIASAQHLLCPPRSNHKTSHRGLSQGPALSVLR
jgi:hypothetical protein